MQTFQIYGRHRRWVQSLATALPHGSGINSTWEITDMKSYVRAEGTFSPMNEHGFYLAAAPFTVIIRGSPSGTLGFKLHFNGSWSQYMNQRFMLRDFLEEDIQIALDSWKKCYTPARGDG